MVRGFGAVARLTGAVLLAAGVLVVPWQSSTAGVARAAGCPSPPVTVAKLAYLAPGQALACYGSRLLTFRAYVPRPTPGDGVSVGTITPRWLDSTFGSAVTLATGPTGNQTPAFVPPALGRCYEGDMSTCPFRCYWGRWVTVSAHFDGPVAQTCRYADHPPGPGFTTRDAVAGCRMRLIVLSVGSVAPPDTATVAVQHEGRDGPSPGLLAVAALTLASLLLLARQPSRRSWTSRAPGSGGGSG